MPSHKIIGNKQNKNNTKQCNCRKTTKCPMKGENCRKENLIHEVNIRTRNKNKIYIGLSVNEIKSMLIQLNYPKKYTS